MVLHAGIFFTESSECVILNCLYEAPGISVCKKLLPDGIA